MRKAQPGEDLTIVLEGLIHQYDWRVRATTCGTRLVKKQLDRLKYRLTKWMGYAPDLCQSCYETGKGTIEVESSG